MDDSTCLSDSEAWTYMIRYFLDPDSLYRSGLLCDFYSGLPALHPAPSKLDTVLTHLATAEGLCS